VLYKSIIIIIIIIIIINCGSTKYTSFVVLSEWNNNL